MLNGGHMIIVVRRNSYDQALQDAVERVPPKQLAQLCIDEEWSGPDISSSRIRSALKAGDWQAVTAMVPPRVPEVIRAHLLATKGKTP